MRPRVHRPAFLVMVPAGVLAGHGLAYLAFGHGHEASHHLDHGYLAVVAALAVPLAVAGLATAGWRPATTPVGPTAPVGVAPYAALQAAIFVLQEAVEHAIAGHDPASLLDSPLLWTGLLAQAIVAAGITLAIRAAEAVGSRSLLVAKFGSGLRLPALSPWRPMPVAPMPRPVTFGRPAGRGPPCSRF